MMRYLWAALGSLLLFVPIGLFLQWWLPTDGPEEILVLLWSSPLLFLSLAVRFRIQKSVASPAHGSLIVGTLLLFAYIQVFTFSPQISRRVGPWAHIRVLLLKSSSDVTKAREHLGIAPGRPLTRQEADLIESMALRPAPTYTFPFLKRTVTVRLLTRRPPYVGLNYGQGRNVVFDLRTMKKIYAD